MKKRWFSLVLVLAMVLSLCTTAFAAKPAQADSGSRVLSGLRNPRADSLTSRLSGQYKPGDQVRAIVLAKSRPTADNGSFLQQAFNTYEKLLEEHNAIKQKLQQLAIAFTVNFEYTALLNGMSLTLDFADLDAVAALPGVADVILATEYRLPETEPSSLNASDMINADWLNDEISADGSGKVIAVLDTGITADHEAFAVYDGMLQTPAYNRSAMNKEILRLGHGRYYSQKIPYQYDYADQDNSAADDNSDHGSHVAGIAAGYAVTSEGAITFRGSAPDAQILAMKIFSSQEETTSSDIYMAALEDAYQLGADVINMSIGATSGFVEDDESVLNDRIYERLENAGIICCVSAGNEGSMADSAENLAGPGYLTTGYVDYGMLGSPASYNGNVAVASAENVAYPAYQIHVGGEGFSYRDSDGTAFLDQFSGQDLPYVMIPGFGAAEDFEGLDVQGKVAVISRGEITFEEKTANAAAAGAGAVIVYDNQDGALVSMSIETKTIPSIFVSQETGAVLAAQADKTLHVDDEATIVENPEAWSISSFSSWGPTNDLQIKPVITGIGGNVNSVTAGTKNGYQVMSGTSMSAPNAAGGYASLLDAICAEHPELSKAEAAAIARRCTVSSAQVLTAYEDGDLAVPYSPRQQGAGCLDLQAAYRTTLVIADPLAELGDDPARSGVYTITADLENTADVKRTYTIRADVLTDAVVGDDFGTEDAPDFRLYNAMMPAALEQGVDYTLSGPKKITLAPGEKRTVTVKITLTDDVKNDYLDACFENGAFIDGYLTFESSAAKESQHVTFLAFYGDWTAAPILETHDWRELMHLDEDQLEDWQYYVDWEIDTVPTEAYLVDEEYSPMLYAGDAPFGYPKNGAYSDARIAVSSNADQAYSTRLLVVPVSLRNARHIIMLARDAETGQIYTYDDTPYARKIIYDYSEGWSVSCWFLFDGTDTYSGSEAKPIADDTRVVLEFYANLPYGEDALGSMTPEEIAANGAQYLEYSVPCVVDSAAPVIERCEFDHTTGDVTVVVKDNQYLAAVYAVDEEGTELAEAKTFADSKPGKRHTVKLNVGEQKAFYIAAIDYATNESSELVSQPIEITQQPQDAYARIGDSVQFTVEATGNGLSYQWQYKSPLSSVWRNSLMPGAKTDTVTVSATALRNGQQYRCVLTDAVGSSVTTDAATLTLVTAPRITKHPESTTVPGGESTQLTVTATGGGLSYQWQYKAPGSSEWKDSSMPGAKTDTITVQGFARRNGQQYRCVVTNAAGSATSRAATLTVVIPLTITSQPKDVKQEIGEKARFRVTAKGIDVHYQWQYKAPGSSEWKDSTMPGANSPVVIVTATAHRNGQQYRCVVSDATESLISEAATLTSVPPLAITAQPKDTLAALDSTATFTVKATGDGLTYQWQYKNASGGAWTNCTAATKGYHTAQLQVAAQAKRSGYQYRCVVTAANGKVVYSDPAKLTVSDARLIIVTQPKSVTAAGSSTARFTVEASGTNVKYQWQYKNASGGAWTNCTAATRGYNTAQLQVAAQAKRDGYQYRCVVTDTAGNRVVSKAAKLTVQ